MDEIAYEGPMEATQTTFAEFFLAEYQTLLRAMYLITGNRNDAEELAQEALVKACERWDKVGRMENPSGYVYRIALNAHRSTIRRLRLVARRAISADPADLYVPVGEPTFGAIGPEIEAQAKALP